MKYPKQKATLLNVDGDKLTIQRYANGPHLDLNGNTICKLTVSRARKIVAALMPYTEWTPDLYGRTLEIRPDPKPCAECGSPSLTGCTCG